MLASINAYYQVIQPLLKSADPNFLNKDSENTLMSASGNDYYHVVEVLLIAGANLNLKDANDCTVLMFTIQNGNYQVVKIFLRENSDSTCHLHFGWTASVYANQNGHFEIAHLLEKYIDPSSSCKELDQSRNQPVEITSSVILYLINRQRNLTNYHKYTENVVCS